MQRLRPAERGGVGWQRPLRQTLFRKPPLGQLWDWLTLNNMERLIVRSDDEQSLLAAAWVESGLGGLRTRLTLFNDPALPLHYAESLLHTLVRRFRMTALSVEHPFDDAIGSGLLQKYHFRPERTLWHMRYDLPQMP